MEFGRIYLYSDASYCKESDIAVLGHSLQLEPLSCLELSSLKQLCLKVVEEKNNIRAELCAAILALSQCSDKQDVTLY